MDVYDSAVKGYMKQCTDNDNGVKPLYSLGIGTEMREI